MTDIIFHIGFPKCASTTLQNQGFANDPYYLGTKKGLEKEKNFAKQFQRFSPIGVNFYGNIHESRKWTERVMKLHSQSENSISRFILSSELFTNRNRLKPRPIIPFLKKFQEEVWSYGKVKVVLVLRNQMDKLSSGYAQVSKTNRQASQSDFEKYLKSYLRKNNHLLNYHHWVKELYQTFGQENVCILLMEEINDLSFWTNLKDFCQLNDFEPFSMINSDKINSKQISKDSWLVQDYNLDEHIKVVTNKVFDLVWPAYVFSSLRNNLNSKTKRAAKYLFAKFETDKVYRIDNSIVLSENARNELMKAFKDSNIQLEKKLGKDLKTLGYYF